MLLSILIPTLDERELLLSRLLYKLRGQIERDKFENQVEILVLRDNREISIGAKRNALIDMASAEFVAFVDDDDDVHEDYIRLIVTALSQHPDVDCLGITGMIYFRGDHPRRFVHSLQYDQYLAQDGVYYRPPYILNPMRRTIAQQFRFAETRYAEDAEWAMRIARAKALHAEHFLDEILYRYYSRRSWFLQWNLDITEPLRHPLGLQFANLVRWKRWLSSRL